MAGTLLDLTASPSSLLSTCLECRLEIISDRLVFDFEVEEAIRSSELKLRPNQTSSADFLIKGKVLQDFYVSAIHPADAIQPEAFPSGQVDVRVSWNVVFLFRAVDVHLCWGCIDCLSASIA